MSQQGKSNTSSERSVQQGMFKNQLQELAQRSCFNLPSYSCIREGPDHAPLFKATVNFNGETFESPKYSSTLRQAEHAAAEVALNTLSKKGLSQNLVASILEETSVCKNLLQETAQRAGVSLPVYTTIRSGPGRAPIFRCIVEVGGRTFTGDAAKTKKQAEKNAAMAAWSSIKQLPLLSDFEGGNEDQSRGMNRAGAWNRAKGGSKSRLNRDTVPSAAFGAQFQRSNGTAEGSFMDYGENRRTMSAWSSVLSHQWRHRTANSGLCSSPLLMSPDNDGRHLTYLPLRPHHTRSRLSWQSQSDRYELRRPELMDELNRDEDWSDHNQFLMQHQCQSLQLSGSGTVIHREKHMFQSQSERFDLRPMLLDELYPREDEEWAQAENRLLNRDRRPIDYRNASFSLFSDSNEFGETAFTGSCNVNDYGNYRGSSYGFGKGCEEAPFTGDVNQNEYNSYNSGSLNYGEGSKAAVSASYDSNSGPNNGAGCSSMYIEKYTDVPASYLMQRQHLCVGESGCSNAFKVSCNGPQSGGSKYNENNTTADLSASYLMQQKQLHNSKIAATSNSYTAGYRDSLFDTSESPPGGSNVAAVAAASTSSSSSALPSIWSQCWDSPCSSNVLSQSFIASSPALVRVQQSMSIPSALPPLHNSISCSESALTFPQQLPAYRGLPSSNASSFSATLQLLEQLRL